MRFGIASSSRLDLASQAPCARPMLLLGQAPRAHPLNHEPTHYLNVDLDIQSRVPLDGLIQALGDDVIVLHVGGERGNYEAHVELATCDRRWSADRTILGLIDLVKRLPPRYRRIWDRAETREFNVGVQAGTERQVFELRLERRTLKAITGVKGTLVVTVYAPDLQARERPRADRRRRRRGDR
jgi:hypothetical protein